jgi:DNA-binding NarL/FixJ family response regulator
MAVRVSIVEDDRVTRETLSALVRQEPGLEFLAAYADAESAIVDVPQRTPDVLVVDIGLAPRGSDRLDGPQCVASLKAVRPDLLALMLTVYDDHDRVMEAIRAGASGYILKRSPPAEILKAIKDLRAGGAPLSLQVAKTIIDSFHGRRPSVTRADPRIDTLTPRERDVLTLLAEGASSKEIATKLGLTAGTVRAHLHTIYGKLGVENRTQAAVLYLGR